MADMDDMACGSFNEASAVQVIQSGCAGIRTSSDVKRRRYLHWPPPRGFFVGWRRMLASADRRQAAARKYWCVHVCGRVNGVRRPVEVLLTCILQTSGAGTSAP